MARRLTAAMGAGLVAVAVSAGVVAGQSPSTPAEGDAGVTGPGLASLFVPEGEVGVVAAGAWNVDAPLRGEVTTIVAVVGNGTDAPVDPTVAWAASAADGSLVWAGEVGRSRSSVNDVLLEGSVPRAVAPGGLGILIASVDQLPEDSTYTFAARADEADDDGPAVAIVSAALTNGRIVGELLVRGGEPVERGFSVIGVCLGTDGAITGGNGLYVDVDEPVEPGGTATFDLDLLGDECTDWVVGAYGS
jgi:hypothetical protein